MLGMDSFMVTSFFGGEAPASSPALLRSKNTSPAESRIRTSPASTSTLRFGRHPDL
jgi:hypothetical protein